MKKLFDNFNGTSKAAWITLLEKELKGESIAVLQKMDAVEEIAYPSYFHREDATPENSDPAQKPFVRGYQTENNNWNITTCFRIEEASATNKEILQALMQGTEHVYLQLTSAESMAFEMLLAGVDLNYCWVSLEAETKAQVEAFLRYTGGKNARVIYKNPLELLSLTNLATTSTRLFTCNGYAVQQAGATSWQELSIALAVGHEVFVQLLDQGINPTEAANWIQFQVGIGNQYFFEVAKIRALRELWSGILAQYITTALPPTTILARTGFVNISLKDPYTNLLRQTTEALSAAVGGVNDLLIQPYDWYANQNDISFTRRMATNISLLLKEESYVHLVIDPAGGSYALDNLTETIAERAWAEFQRIERDGTIENKLVKTTLSDEIRQKAQQRIAALNDKSSKRIGINIFPNPEKVDGTWKDLPQAWNGLPTLNLEQHYEQA